MDLKKTIGPGIYPMLYSFFDHNGSLRTDPFLQQVDAALNAGTSGIAVLGLGTEVSKLDLEERDLVISIVAKRINGACPLLVTLRGDTAQDQVSAGIRAQDLGASALLLQPPSEPISDSNLFDFFSDVIGRMDCPVGIQNAPEFLGYGLSDGALLRLAETHANFSIAKLECSAVALEPIATALAGKTMVFNGRCGLELPDTLRAGAAGLIPGTETIDKSAAIFAAFKSGDIDRADLLYQDVLPVLTFIMQGIPHFLTYGKGLLALRLAIEPGSSRAPWLQQTNFGRKMITRYAEMLGPLETGS